MNPGPNATKYIFVTGGVVSSSGKASPPRHLDGCSWSEG